MTSGRFRVTVPASTANIGPGFDTFGLALELCDVLEVEQAGSTSVEIHDAGAGGTAQVPTDESHLVLRALRRACEHLAIPVPDVRLRCHNAIPHARGLGSSAAAVVAGLSCGYHFAGLEPDHRLLGLAAEFEGHADNAAASLLGGFVLAWTSPDGPRAERLEPHPVIRPVIAVPQQRSSTDATRGLLPEQIPHADGAFTASRAALAVHAMTARPQLLLAATEDRLHQDYRASAMRASAALVRELRGHGVPATISGAGPSVLALTDTGTLPCGVTTAGFQVRELPIARSGIRIDPT